MKQFFWGFNAATLESFQVSQTYGELSTAAEGLEFFFRLKEPFEGEVSPPLPACRESETEQVVEGLVQKKKGKQGCEEGMKGAKELLAAVERTTICERNATQTPHQQPSCRDKTSHLATFNHHRFLISVPKAATASISSTNTFQVFSSDLEPYKCFLTSPG